MQTLSKSCLFLLACSASLLIQAFSPVLQPLPLFYTCDEAAISWTNGTPPFTLTIKSTSDISSGNVEVFSGISVSSHSWLPDMGVCSITVSLIDATYNSAPQELGGVSMGNSNACYACNGGYSVDEGASGSPSLNSYIGYGETSATSTQCSATQLPTNPTAATSSPQSPSTPASTASPVLQSLPLFHTCEEAVISWTNGTPPFTLTIKSTSDISSGNVEVFSGISGSSHIWLPDMGVCSITVSLLDARYVSAPQELGGVSIGTSNDCYACNGGYSEDEGGSGSPSLNSYIGYGETSPTSTQCSATQSSTNYPTGVSSSISGPSGQDSSSIQPSGGTADAGQAFPPGQTDAGTIAGAAVGAVIGGIFVLIAAWIGTGCLRARIHGDRGRWREDLPLVPLVARTLRPEGGRF